eukprot:TRINITY_DN1032_c0_g2_i3.p1 TRINITY_DN1032_c0_g2~~TRINITY_DN1032_c0_g2_i3.p1  ORF type:complete len:377 (+),score=81.79 TRINITY_DN1032_c0_g2_i3:142-1272(+)
MCIRDRVSTQSTGATHRSAMASCWLTLLLLAAVNAEVPLTMRAIQATGSCSAPFSCVHVQTVSTPKPAPGQALIRVNATSVNPSDVDNVELGGCTSGCGADVAGTVISCPGCTRLKSGDAVWTLSNPAYSDYLVAPETTVGRMPAGLEFSAAGTVPEVGLTSLFSLKRTNSTPGSPMPQGSPWSKQNLTVVITSGAGGTGFMGIELAKAWGATNIVTSTTGAAGIAFVKSLGATVVVDYHSQNVFDALPDDSVDIVYDNYGADGTADKAMRTLRAGGSYLLLPHGDCFMNKTQGPPCLAAHPKPGVRQLNYDTGADFGTNELVGLDELKGLFESGDLSAHIDRGFSLAQAAQAFNYSAGSGSGGVSHHIGKISITA